ncbi:UDP-glucose 4-epimerase GalE [Evansella cellulosilytica]|uniref:UDP-glucose 4-epimerase n=1 Tax=Evansella cellulosilytica (strain ATCC 21833 / DSM 2522 / FERM P-1141 / JCM 9156 / N-4) TaxID=649639 RepID=E6TQD9_EVAC2|nr:UDP-glucose 4-epimerase GalE [Evansella cellulosilytica]ADU29317.1 UDP-glucose 4-epimerase [Evansella cellulosilytica DSM 2522]
MAVLVCGGAGYIGSHAVADLLDRGEQVVVLDNLQTGHEKGVLEAASFYHGDLRNEAVLDRVFQENEVDSVLHFAADSLVGVSMEKPLEYYENNVYGAICLLKKMKEYGVKHIVFSSTAATYGEPESVPILETDKTAPTNPYGETKLAIERLLKWCDEAYGIKHVILRYFNVAGAHPTYDIGEDHQPETHLIPIVLQVALGQRDAIKIFGDDYPTEDGSCIRDYIHVSDLIHAHLLALDHLRCDKDSDIFNLGNGNGFSVKQVIDAVETVTGKTIQRVVEGRRPGDPAILIASSTKAAEKLGWKPIYTSLEDIISTAWKWQQAHQNGYGK